MRALVWPCLLAAIACGGAGDDLVRHHPSLADLERPLVIGHSGSSLLCARNTIECYRHALDVGAQGFEADLQVLGDGTLVMFHDDDTAPQTGESHLIAELTLAQIQALDAGWAVDPAGDGTYPLRGRGLRVPTFREFLDAFPGVPVLLDVKVETEAMAAALLDFVPRELGEDERRRVYIKTNDAALPERLRALEPPPRVALSDDERLGLALTLSTAPERAPSYAPTWIDISTKNAPRGTLELFAPWATAHGHVISASTVDTVDDAPRDAADPESPLVPGMRTLTADRHLTGIVTNRPDLLAQLLGR